MHLKWWLNIKEGSKSGQTAEMSPRLPNEAQVRYINGPIRKFYKVSGGLAILLTGNIQKSGGGGGLEEEEETSRNGEVL